MPRGLRASDAPRIQSLIGTDQRLLLRVGALLQQRLAFTASVLEELAGNPALRTLAMDARLRTATEADFATLITDHGLSDLDLALIAETDENDRAWRVVAFADEIDNPLISEAEPSPEPDETAVPGVAALLPSLSPQVRAPLQGLLEARADEQRAAALEQLRYASPPLRVVAELMPMVLADGADLVRERAISLLVAAGAKSVVADLVRAIQRDDERSLLRLAEQIHELEDEQAELVIAALVAAAARGRISPGLIAVATALAPTLAGHPALTRLIELLLPQSRRVSLVSLVRALQRIDTDRIDAALRALLGQSKTLDSRLIVLLTHPGASIPDDLLERGIDLLLEPDEEPVDRMALAAALRRMQRDRDLAARLAARGEAILAARESTVYWLLAELCRAGAVAAEEGDRLAVILRILAGRDPGPHTVAMLEQQLPALVPASAATRESLVEPLAELVVGFRDRRSRELVGEVLVGMGEGVHHPLWRLLAESPHRSVRLLASEALAELVMRASGEEAAEAVDLLVSAARRAADRQETGAHLAAAGRIAQHPAIGDPEPSRRVDEACQGLGDRALAAWGHIAAGPYVGADRRAELLELLLVGITADIPDLPAEEVVDPNTQDTTYILDARLGSHTDSVPVMLAAARRIGTSPHLPAPLLRRLVGELCRQWKRVSNWEVIWGPGNIQDLGQTLGHLARRQDFPAALRRQVAEALLPRVTQLSIAGTLAGLFGSNDAPGLGELAARAATAIIQAAAREEFADDERSELTDVLTGFLLVDHLGDDEEVVRRRLAGLLTTHRKHLALRSREQLRARLERFGPSVQERLSWLER